MIGQSLSHFQITAKLGEGGMGEVWRAEDTKLGREVAIKVLPQALASDTERLARFAREAQVLASLNHQNVAGIHEFRDTEVGGERLHFLVMELATGQDLAERLRQGPLPLEDAAPIALQIAEGLEAAHERGVVHRDLKPANVMIAPDGQVKILDFGLAKALEGPGGGEAASLSVSPTLTAAMTAAGVLLGTAAYMSPEQAKGLETDRRTDVWAFGVLVWEMLTGKRLFAGDSVSDTLAAVLRDEIDPGELPSDTPAVLHGLLGRCLDRDPRSRLRDIGEARVALAALVGGAEISTVIGVPALAPAEEPAAQRSSKLPWVLAAVTSAAALALGFLAFRPGEAPRPMVRSTLLAPQDTQLDVGSGLTLSPDGSRLAFTALDADGRRALWVRSLADGETRRLNGTDWAMYPFWSPDGQHLAFMVPGHLRRVPASGGPVQTLAPVSEGRGGAWGRDGNIVFAPDFRGGLFQVPAAGGEVVELTQLDRDRGEQAHRFPVFLPDGERVLFLSQTAEGGMQSDDSRIEVLDLASSERSPVVTANSSMAVSPTGHLLFLRDGALMVAELDLASATLRGEPVPIEEGVGYTGNEFATFSIAGTELLVHQSGSLYELFTRLVETDASGVELGEASAPDYHQDVKLSHDGRRAVYRGVDNTTLWVHDLERHTRTRFTFEDGDHFTPVWSPDDQFIAYATDRTDRTQIFRKPSSGLGEAELLFETDLQVNIHDWSPDGRHLSLAVLDHATDTDRDVALLELETRELTLLAQSPFLDAHGVFSPDGRWMAYTSAESDQMEIFLVPVPGPGAEGRGGRFQVSTAGGGHADWDPSGKRLYYVNPLVELMAVDLDLDAAIEIGRPEKLFQIRHQYNQDPPFQVMPDGESFLTSQLEQEIRGGNLTLVQNWGAKLGE